MLRPLVHRRPTTGTRSRVCDVVKLLHTSDWHVGKTIRGISRAEEHRAVFAEMISIAQQHDVDVVLVAGDLFETASPGPEAEQIVWQALLELASVASHVVVIAGNHDNPRRLSALADVFALGNVHLVAEARRPDEGGVIQLDVETQDSEPQALDIVALPFVSKRGIVRTDALMELDSFELQGVYAERIGQLLDLLSAHRRTDALQVVMTHGFVLGGGTAGGERPAHLADEYALPAQLFSASTNYVALGHLHKAQKIPGATAIHYSGSPLQLDFGDPDANKSVNIVELKSGAPAKVTKVKLDQGRRLRTLTGSLGELRDADIGDDWLRVRVTEARRPDLADQVREVLGPNCVDVLIDAPDEPREIRRNLKAGRSPRQLFEAYLEDLNIDDPRLLAMFDELLVTHESGGS